ncbi:hypothetical protein CsSME_00020425 [Camellia sinensis var. sinensis]
MLTSKSEVSEVHCVKDAKVPLMRFKLDGISIDLPYAQLKVMIVPKLSVMHAEPNLSKQSVPTVVSAYTQGSHVCRILYLKLYLFDLPCYDLQNVDILNPFFLSNIDETSWYLWTRPEGLATIVRTQIVTVLNLISQCAI